MTDAFFFDSDCLSAFLWVGNENLLTRMYPGRIIIPKPVYDELSYHGILHLKAKVDRLLSQNEVKIETIFAGTDTYALYRKLTEHPDFGHIPIGKGEASSIALAKQYGGIVASNNLRDIRSYIEEWNLKHVTTGDILVEAYERGLITLEQGDIIWKSMLAKRRKLGAATFTDYCLQHRIS